MKKTVMQKMMPVLYTFAAVYIVIGLLLFLLQEKLVFLPSDSITATPANVGLSFEDHYFPSENGNMLHGWFTPSGDPDQSVTILFCHGNAGNISGRLPLIQLFHSLGYNVFIFDYQGYGLSEGKPGEKEILQDGLAAWDFLTEELRIPENTIMPLGRSLGGSVAAHIASEKKPRALALESTFTSVPDVARRSYRIFPVNLLARIHLPTAEFVSQFEGPVLVAHSREDRLIPYEMGKKLYDIVSPNGVWLELSGDHNDGYVSTGAAYGNGYAEFIEQQFKHQFSDRN